MVVENTNFEVEQVEAPAGRIRTIVLVSELVHVESPAHAGNSRQQRNVGLQDLFIGARPAGSPAERRDRGPAVKAGSVSESFLLEQACRPCLELPAEHRARLAPNAVHARTPSPRHDLKVRVLDGKQARNPKIYLFGDTRLEIEGRKGSLLGGRANTGVAKQLEVRVGASARDHRAESRPRSQKAGFRVGIAKSRKAVSHGGELAC